MLDGTLSCKRPIYVEGVINDDKQTFSEEFFLSN